MSTAKSMANQYLSAKRAAGKSNTLSAIASASQHRFKSSTSNLASNGISSRNGNSIKQNNLKATSMTNLASDSAAAVASRLQRPASRNALDNIHNGMNAKYAQVQSKVLLQNIRPQQGQQQQQTSKIPATKSDTLTRRTPVNVARSTPSPIKAPNERSAMINKLKQLQEELERAESERETIKQELERERADKLEQVQQSKLELQEKIAEHDKQNEEYHQKLLEAYELADQNRRAADQVLNESRQRAEEARKKTEELESQLSELKEFVAMKDEMTDKMYELKEQIREERQRYEEQLKSLHQVFENEKISNRKFQRDQNSNYFSRVKPSLEASNESISQRGTGCQKCRSGSSQLHKSEQDIYGSKLSTRMQDTAKSAWKSSKKFASSVITGGVNLTGCRKGSSDINGGRAATKQQIASADHQQQDVDESAAEHTSVVHVNSAAIPSTGENIVEAQQTQLQEPSLIRVDASKKLTIVTKFNDDQLLRRPNGNSPPQSSEMAPSSGGSERSRCESSSSGRGTSSDAGSAASQNGDDKEDSSHKIATSGGSDQARPTSTSTTSDISKKTARNKQRKASSLFKASKIVFGGSQVSLNKLKNFFNGGSKQLRTQQQQQLQTNGDSGCAGESPGGAVEIADAENASRLRCMELNQAIKKPSMSAVQTSSFSSLPSASAAAAEQAIKLRDAENHTGSENDEQQTSSKVEIGQGESEIKSDQQQQPALKEEHQVAMVVC